MNGERQSIGFWSALVGTCRGVALFPALVKNSWPRVILHLLAMTLICSAGIAWGEYRRIRPVIDAVELAFADSFGARIFNSGTGMRPEREPAVAREMALPRGGTLFYTGDDPGGPGLDGAVLETLDYFIVWAPGGLLMAFEVENEEWVTTTWNNSAFRMMLSSFGAPLDNRAVAAVASKLPPADKWQVGRDEETVSAIFDSMRSAMVFCLFFGNTVILLALAVVITAMFALMYRLFGVRRMRYLGVGNYWKTGIYAGFPVMLVAGCFPALALPFLNYGIVYIFGLAIYWMIAANSQEAAAERDGDGHGER